MPDRFACPRSFCDRKTMLVKPRLRLAAAAGLAAALAAGCASYAGLAPRASPGNPDSLSAERSLAGAKLSPAVWPASDWWKRFGDPQLNALVDEALSGSPTIGAARAAGQGRGARASGRCRARPAGERRRRQHATALLGERHFPAPDRGFLVYAEPACAQLRLRARLLGKK